MLRTHQTVFPTNLQMVVMDNFQRLNQVLNLNYHLLKRLIPQSVAQGTLFTWSLKSQPLLSIRICTQSSYTEQICIHFYMYKQLEWLNEIQARANVFHDSQQLEIIPQKPMIRFCRVQFQEHIQMNRLLFSYLKALNSSITASLDWK